MRVNEESEKTWNSSLELGLELNIKEAKIMTSSPITSWQIDGGKVETVTDFRQCIKTQRFTLPTKIHRVKPMVLGVIVQLLSHPTLRDP